MYQSYKTYTLHHNNPTSRNFCRYTPTCLNSVYVGLFIAALFAKVKGWKLPKSTLTGDRSNKLGHIHKVN